MSDIWHPREVRRFEGFCDVCGVALEHIVRPDDGVMDTGFDEEHQVIYTWIRHYATAPAGANPDCAVYSSRVYEVHSPASGP